VLLYGRDPRSKEAIEMAKKAQSMDPDSKNIKDLIAQMSAK
jgi:hypothetical protein